MILSLIRRHYGPLLIGAAFGALIVYAMPGLGA